jgi:hypothetical protein
MIHCRPLPVYVSHKQQELRRGCIPDLNSVLHTEAVFPRRLPKQNMTRTKRQGVPL